VSAEIAALAADFDAFTAQWDRDAARRELARATAESARLLRQTWPLTISENVYVEVPPAYVPGAAIAYATVKRLGPELGVAPVARFYRPWGGMRDETPVAFIHVTDVAGTCPSADLIWLDASFTGERMVRLVAHEMRHAAQYGRGADMDGDLVLAEADANVFALGVAPRLARELLAQEVTT